MSRVAHLNVIEVACLAAIMLGAHSDRQEASAVNVDPQVMEEEVVRGPSLTPTQLAARQAFERLFHVSIARPTVFDATCHGTGHLTSTAYLKTPDGQARLLTLYLSGDGSRVLRATDQASVMAPAGTFHVLVVLMGHTGVIDAQALGLWEEAQAGINREHETVAREAGRSQPIVAFANTNVIVKPEPGTDPKSRQSVLRAAEAIRGTLSESLWDVVVSLNLDPSGLEGGFAEPSDAFIYMGNYDGARERLSSEAWRGIAHAVYDHEMAHLWGWPSSHDWAPLCDGRRSWGGPSVAPPGLFGWDDLDGDVPREPLQNHLLQGPGSR